LEEENDLHCTKKSATFRTTIATKMASVWVKRLHANTLRRKQEKKKGVVRRRTVCGKKKALGKKNSDDVDVAGRPEKNRVIFTAKGRLVQRLKKKKKP